MSQTIDATSIANPSSTGTNSKGMPLDDVAPKILKFLSGGQQPSIHELGHLLGLPMDRIWVTLLSMQKKTLVDMSGGRVFLTAEGHDFVRRWGISSSDSTHSLAERKRPGPASWFGTIGDFFLWLTIPALAQVLIIGIGLAMTVGPSLNTMPIIRDALLSAVLVLTILAEAIFLRKYWASSFHRVSEYESLVVFRLGNCIGSRGPGPVLLVPFFDRPTPVDLRVAHLEVPHESCITQDNVQIDVDFVLYWKVENPVWSVNKVRSPEESLNLLATGVLRNVIAHFPFNEVLNQREGINNLLKDKIDEISTDWGIYVTTVEIREIKPPKEIVDSMHLQRSAEWQRQAEVTKAEGYRQAQIKRAEGDSSALKMLYEVAKSIDERTLNLKYFDTLRALGEGSATKYIFPMELLNLVKPLAHRLAEDDGKPHDSISENTNGDIHKE